jgi:hypothetical protein
MNALRDLHEAHVSPDLPVKAAISVKTANKKSAPQRN